MTNRRRFLKLLGVGTASAPLAAHALTQDQMAGQAGIKNFAPFSSDTGIAEAAEDAASYPKPISNPMDAGAKYLQKYGKLPDHVERKLRDDARNITYLDYDIANKCWSLSVKVQEQRQRNYERNVLRYREGDSYEQAQKAFEAVTGFKWPW